MGSVRTPLAVLSAAVVACGAAGCGSSTGRWLSPSQADRLTGQIYTITEQLNGGSCGAAERSISRLRSSLSALIGVNSTLVANLEQGARTIQSLASSQCVSAVVTPPAKPTRPKRRTTTSTTPASTNTVTTFTNPTTSDTTPASTQTTPSITSTSTTGGASPTVPATSTSATTTTGGDSSVSTTGGGNGNIPTPGPGGGVGGNGASGLG